MNTPTITCACNNCPGAACNCGCQQAAGAVSCGCGPQCQCGSQCACAAQGGMGQSSASH